MIANAVPKLQLKNILKREVAHYLAHSLTSRLYSLFDDEQEHYAIVALPNLPRPFPSRVVVMARIEGDTIVIEEDITDKPLVNALLTNGAIPREQIVLAYAGETIPT